MGIFVFRFLLENVGSASYKPSKGFVFPSFSSSLGNLETTIHFWVSFIMREKKRSNLSLNNFPMLFSAISFCPQLLLALHGSVIPFIFNLTTGLPNIMCLLYSHLFTTLLAFQKIQQTSHFSRSKFQVWAAQCKDWDRPWRKLSRRRRQRLKERRDRALLQVFSS